jgi:hypothetical protein
VTTILTQGDFAYYAVLSDDPLSDLNDNDNPTAWYWTTFIPMLEKQTNDKNKVQELMKK